MMLDGGICACAVVVCARGDGGGLPGVCTCVCDVGDAPYAILCGCVCLFCLCVWLCLHVHSYLCVSFLNLSL